MSSNVTSSESSNSAPRRGYDFQQKGTTIFDSKFGQKISIQDTLSPENPPIKEADESKAALVPGRSDYPIQGNAGDDTAAPVYSRNGLDKLTQKYNTAEQVANSKPVNVKV